MLNIETLQKKQEEYQTELQKHEQIKDLAIINIHRVSGAIAAITELITVEQPEEEQPSEE